MAGNSFGKLFKLTTYGESHGQSIGGVVDGVPANFPLDLNAIQQELDRRKPGQSKLVTQRKEQDKVVFKSGLFEGKTTGAPIGFEIQNTNHKTQDYDHLKDQFRPSHADFTYQAKYGHRDYRGGGRSSARETASRVVAGAIAKQFLSKKGIQINAFVDQVGDIKINHKLYFNNYLEVENNLVRCPDVDTAKAMENLIFTTRKAGDTIGGAIACHVNGVPAGLGEPVFDKLHADLGKAMLSINAVKGFEYGSGFDAITMNGSEHNDLMLTDATFSSNFSGGIQGGISNGMPIYMRIAFKPVATLMKNQISADAHNKMNVVKGKGRHDACVVPRAVVIVESMAAITILDHFLRHQSLNVFA